MLRALYRHTLASNVFGITLMAVIGIYLAVGSGMPRVREYFELTDLQFFAAWPLRVLMVLLIVNLAVVTWTRIPFTPPRYGVWCIHCGIVTLIIGMGLYYHLKMEGRAFLQMGQSAAVFYDSAERSLYLRAGEEPMIRAHPLPDLPRWNAYVPTPDHPDALPVRGLKNISTFNAVGPEDPAVPLQQVFHTAQPITIDILGFYPYAQIVPDWQVDPSAAGVGIELAYANPHSGKPVVHVITDADERLAHRTLGEIELEHRQVTAEELKTLRATDKTMVPAADPSELLPTEGVAKHTLLTTDDNSVTDIFVAAGSAVSVSDHPDGVCTIKVPIEGPDGSLTALEVTARRMDHLRTLTRIVPIPPAQLNADQLSAEDDQVLMAKVTCGSWSDTVAVPFNAFPVPDADTLNYPVPWHDGMVRIPGADVPLQLQLGDSWQPLPEPMTLTKFELVHYPGGHGENGPFKDFISTLELAGEGGEHRIEQAHLNSPVYVDGGKWLYFQAGYDPQAQWSIIGVGNRPGMLVMIMGCVEIVLGLLYAFYVKPMMVGRMTLPIAECQMPNSPHPNPPPEYRGREKDKAGCTIAQ